MYWPYQRPKRCWKCGGNKIWAPEYNKWVCPQCRKPTQAYFPPTYPQYDYAPRQQPIYRGPPPTQYQRQPSPTYQTSRIYQPILQAGNKLCIYCGASMKEDEAICPKCMQRALMV